MAVLTDSERLNIMKQFGADLSEAKHLLALELAWTPRRLYYGDGMAHSAKLPLYSASGKY